LTNIYVREEAVESAGKAKKEAWHGEVPPPGYINWQLVKIHESLIEGSMPVVVRQTLNTFPVFANVCVTCWPVALDPSPKSQK
jgi:hypothetical protein